MPLTLLTRAHGRLTTDHPSPIPAPATVRSWLTRLFAGEVELPAVAPAALRLSDRTPAEKVALSRALACPDLFIFDAADRAQRERLIADLLRLAAERGECVLALSPDPAAADRLVESLAAERTHRVVRALADDENPHRPSPAVTRLTTRSIGSGRAEQLKREAALSVSTLEAKLSRFERSRTLRAKLDEVERERKEIAARLDSLSTTSDSRIVEELTAKRDAALAPLVSERTVLAAKRTEREAALAVARGQKAESLKKPGLLSRLFGNAKPAVDATALDAAIITLEGEVKAFAEREAKLRGEEEEITRQCAEEVEKQATAATASRRAEFESQLREKDAEATRLDLAIREFLPPRAALDDTVENGVPSPGTRAELERELAVARTRVEELALAGSDLARRLLAESQIVIGTPGCLDADPVFKALAASFGLLVLDHAEELTEPALTRLSALANRCVLAGEVAVLEEPRPHLNGNGRHHAKEPTLLARLARRLDAEPWCIEGDRLVFRLVHLTGEKRKALWREPVLDHPHVELRVSVADGGDPVVAEIAFPANTTIVQAKGFLFSQLDEVLLRPCGERHWHRTEDRLTACWPMIEAGTGEWVELEPGVRELVAGADPAAFTTSIAFDLAGGWDEEKAEAWLLEHLPAASASRLAVLPRTALPVQRAVPVS